MSANATMNFYLALSESTRTVIGESTADSRGFGDAQQRVDDLNRWRTILAPRPESIVLQHALNEATVGLFLLASGLYRSAFVSLRLFLELSLAGIHYSTNRLDLAEWIDGRRDIRWGTLLDVEGGVLSPRYAQAFFPELRDSVSMYGEIAAKIYRELSEFVHGNHQTWGSARNRIEFSREVQERWFTNFSDASRAVMYALCLRFLKELSDEDLARVSALVQDCLGHVEPIRSYLALTKG